MGRTPVLAPTSPSSLLSGTVTAPGPGRYLVGVAVGQSVPAATLAAAGAVVLDSVPQIGGFEVDAANPAALTSPDVRYVEPSYAIRLDVLQSPALVNGSTDDAAPNITATPSNAAFYANNVQWDMKAMKADYGWANSQGGTGAKVCIVDTGIDDSHQELTGKVVASTSFVPLSPSASLDSNGHGTHVGSTVTGNSVSMASVAPSAKLMAAKVFAETGGTPSLRVAQAITWCADNGAHVINMSLGGITYYPATPATANPSFKLYADAVKYANDLGVVVIASAGNSNLRLPNSAQLVTPAQVPGVIMVGATGPLSKSGHWLVGGTLRTLPLSPPTWNPFDPDEVWFGPDGRAFYSNWGTAVTVFAPGGVGFTPSGYINRIVYDQSTPPVRVQQVAGPNDNVWAACSRYSTFVGSANSGGVPGPGAVCRTSATPRYASLAGTSMAAPHVSGLAALLYGELGASRTTTNRAAVENCIKATDNIGPSTTFGGGRVSVQNALACIRSYIPA
ncbi:MAG TPA: S8 family serine peptidase [Gemmatimonadaceae bacterium]